MTIFETIEKLSIEADTVSLESLNQIVAITELWI